MEGQTYEPSLGSMSNEDAMVERHRSNYKYEEKEGDKKRLVLKRGITTRTRNDLSEQELHVLRQVRAYCISKQMKSVSTFQLAKFVIIARSRYPDCSLERQAREACIALQGYDDFIQELALDLTNAEAMYQILNTFPQALVPCGVDKKGHQISGWNMTPQFYDWVGRGDTDHKRRVFALSKLYRFELAGADIEEVRKGYICLYNQLGIRFRHIRRILELIRVTGACLGNSVPYNLSGIYAVVDRPLAANLKHVVRFLPQRANESLKLDTSMKEFISSGLDVEPDQLHPIFGGSYDLTPREYIASREKKLLHSMEYMRLYEELL